MSVFRAKYSVSSPGRAEGARPGDPDHVALPRLPKRDGRDIGARSDAVLRTAMPGHDISISGVVLTADPAGALYWPEQGLLAVADLHLEKGSSFAARGQLLPPYDTAATLARLARLIARYAPRVVVALGDSFHDGGGPARLAQADRDNLHALQRGRDWLWLAGNHDPEPASNIGGVFQATLALGALTFRHLPAGAGGRDRRPSASGGARRAARPRGQPPLLCRRRDAHGDAGLRRLRRRAQRARSAFADLFGTIQFTAHMLGEDRLYSFAAKRCLPD